MNVRTVLIKPVTIACTLVTMWSLFMVSGPASAAPTVRYFKAAVLPDEATAGSTAIAYEIIIANCNAATCDDGHATTSSQKMGSAEVEVPTGFSSVSSLAAADSAGKTWIATLTGTTIQLMAKTGTDKLEPGESVTVRFNANAPCDANDYEWTASGYGGTDFSTAYTLFQTQPVIAVTGSCYAFSGWQSQDYCTFGQGAWGQDANGNNPGSIRDKDFDSIYGVPGVSIGIGYSMSFETSANVNAYLPACTTPVALQNSFTNPTSTCAGPERSSVSGVLGGQVLALKLNRDFNAAGVLDSLLADFDSVILTGTGSSLDGQTIGYILNLAETALGGGELPSDFNLSTLNTLVDSLNQAFSECEPSEWAQTHLIPQ